MSVMNILGEFIRKRTSWGTARVRKQLAVCVRLSSTAREMNGVYIDNFQIAMAIIVDDLLALE